MGAICRLECFSLRVLAQPYDSTSEMSQKCTDFQNLKTGRDTLVEPLLAHPVSPLLSFKGPNESLNLHSKRCCKVAVDVIDFEEADRMAESFSLLQLISFSEVRSHVTTAKVSRQPRNGVQK